MLACGLRLDLGFKSPQASTQAKPKKRKHKSQLEQIKNPLHVYPQKMFIQNITLAVVKIIFQSTQVMLKHFITIYDYS
jgi:hypothetical protein